MSTGAVPVGAGHRDTAGPENVALRAPARKETGPKVRNPMLPVPGGLVDAAWVAAFLCLPKSTVYDWAESGRLPCIHAGGDRDKPGRLLRFNPEKIIALRIKWEKDSQLDRGSVPVEDWHDDQR